MITRKQLKGAYSEGEALAIFNEVKLANDFIGFARTFIHDQDYQVARNALWGLTKATDGELSQLQQYYKPAVKSVRNRILSKKLKL